MGCRGQQDRVRRCRGSDDLLPLVLGPGEICGLVADRRAGTEFVQRSNAALKRSVTRHSGSILLSTGDNLGAPDANGRLNTTLVIFNMRAKVQDIVPRLVARYPGDTPIALVCEASYTSEKVIVATLDTILAKLGNTKLPQLYLIYVGDALAAPGQPAARTQTKATSGMSAACGDVGKGKPMACSH